MCGATTLAVTISVLAALVGLLYVPDVPVAELKPLYAAPDSGSEFVPLLGMEVHLRDHKPTQGCAHRWSDMPWQKPPAADESAARKNTDGPCALPILLVHGTSASLHTWDGWVARLVANGRRVLRVDIPGFGLTGPPSAELGYEIKHYVKFVLAVADARFGTGSRFILAGNSLGGEITWSTAVAAPDRIAAAVLVDSAGLPNLPKNMPLGFTIAKTPYIRWGLLYILPYSVVAQGLRAVYGDASLVTPALVQRYYDLSRCCGNRRSLPERFSAHSWPPGQRADTVKNVKAPTLIIWGEKDETTMPAMAHRFHADIVGSELAMFPQLGHIPHEEAPDATVARVIEFLHHRNL